MAADWRTSSDPERNTMQINTRDNQSSAPTDSKSMASTCDIMFFLTEAGRGQARTQWSKWICQVSQRCCSHYCVANRRHWILMVWLWLITLQCYIQGGVSILTSKKKVNFSFRGHNKMLIWSVLTRRQRCWDLCKSAQKQNAACTQR